MMQQMEGAVAENINIPNEQEEEKEGVEQSAGLLSRFINNLNFWRQGPNEEEEKKG